MKLEKRKISYTDFAKCERLGVREKGVFARMTPSKGKKETYYCSECGYEAYKWMGRCPDCGSWSCFSPKKAGKLEGSSGLHGELTVTRLQDLETAESERYPTGVGEFDRVLGGGAVKGSVLLLGGDPGIGKSTMALQAAGYMHKTSRLLYISGEESLHQIKMRAARLQVDEGFLVAAQPELSGIMQIVEESNPEVLIIDSVQSMYSEAVDGIPGTIKQVKEVTAGLMHLAKKKNMAIFLIGHVTKEGNIAGPKLLEHMVDGVFYLEGDRYHNFRILRGVKNRFGSTNEIGVFLMNERGLEEVKDPSYLFISSPAHQASGSTITASLNGSRPFLVEIQSLVTTSGYANPRRTSTGLEHNRVALIMAVLEKHVGLSFYGLDAFVNVVGGVRLMEPAVDLAVAVSLASSIRDRKIERKTVMLGEIGLTGEVRPVSRVTPRVVEAEKLGFDSCFLPRQNLKEVQKELKPRLQLHPVDTVDDALEKSMF